MSAISNVGELASPYYLLEVWARRGEIDLDPETYATLKTKARRLVRDYRRFDLRGEQPDDEWFAGRLALLGLADAASLKLAVEGEVVAVRVWTDGGGTESVVVADLRAGTDPDRRLPGGIDPPAAMFERALDTYDGDAGWGLLLAGTRIRVYRRGTGVSAQYLQLDLEQLVELDDEASWRSFAAVFRAPAFSGSDGPPLIRRVVDESRRHAGELAANMRADVVDAAEAILGGALGHPANTATLGDLDPVALAGLFEETLYLLYRVLFVLYAESRDVLPLSGGGVYATTYSIDHLVELARSRPSIAGGTYFADTLAELFELLWAGPAEVTRRLGFAPIGGELFDPARTARLDRCVIDDAAWGRALRSIAVGAEGSTRARLGRRASFAELGVDQLGSIYEGLLSLEAHRSTTTELLVRSDKSGDRRVLPADTALESLRGYRLIRRLEPGEVVLESSSGRRKGSGSFYTPHEITGQLTDAALGPLIEPLVAQAATDPAGAEAALLALRVCDPAMGSGAFLVQAARTLGRGLARIRAATGRRQVTPELIAACERLVVRDCLYGVDLNRLAVALAKVSLWLETLEPGRPLSFLDAHLHWGDSLVGVELTDHGRFSPAALARWPAEATGGLVQYLKVEAGPAGAELSERVKRRKAPKAATQARLPGIGLDGIEASLTALADQRRGLVGAESDAETLEDVLATGDAFAALEAESVSVRNKARAVADLWCAQWFSAGEDGPADSDGRVVAPVGYDDYRSMATCLLEGRPVPERLVAALDAAQKVAAKRRFVHWTLEFPEVIVERGGFDAVIGNPPWNTLSPSDDEFFSTYDPLIFARGVTKPVKEVRKAELRTDPAIDQAWRSEARFLYQLSHWAKPASGNYAWYAADGQLRKGDANVFRLFVERAYRLLRPGGRLAQVLPDSFYISSPATGLRQALLTQTRVESCYVFENRKVLFPIHRSTKVVLLVAEAGTGPTETFRAAFYTGKDPAGRERAVGLDELPDVLTSLQTSAPVLAVEQIRALAPHTWSFPELQTALDAEIAAHCAAVVLPLNLDERGWNLTYCRELDADKDSGRFTDAATIQARGAVRNGLRWDDPEGFTWWPLVEGANFYHLEFPARGREPTKWVRGDEVAGIEARRNPDGTSVMDHYRVAWRDVASATNERSAIATVLPPGTAAKDTSLAVWGGSLDERSTLSLSGLMSSFCFDYLVRFAGKTHLKYAAVNVIAAPPADALEALVGPTAEVVCRSDEFDELWDVLRPGEKRPDLGDWEIGERRAEIDARVAIAYGLSAVQFAAVLSTFPNVDRSQPMLPGEPKCFVTRDLALLAYCQLAGTEPADVGKLLAEAGVALPAPTEARRRLDVRVDAYRELGAIPYRPTPRGGRTPTDPALIEAVAEVLSDEALAAAEVAELLDEDQALVTKVLKALVKEGLVFPEGRGRGVRYYMIEEG